jgi:hypothetical protein
LCRLSDLVPQERLILAYNIEYAKDINDLSPSDQQMIEQARLKKIPKKTRIQ